MINSLKVNQLLAWFVGVHAAYFSFGFLAEMSAKGGIWWSSFVAGCGITAGAVLFAAVFREFVGIIRKGVIGPGQFGVLGIGLIAFGLVYGSAFSMLFNENGRPESWIGALSSYGRACMAAGMALIFLGPRATIEGIKPPPIWLMVVGGLAILAIGFYFGLTFGMREVPSFGEFMESRGPRFTDLMFYRRA